MQAANLHRDGKTAIPVVYEESGRWRAGIASRAGTTSKGCLLFTGKQTQTPEAFEFEEPSSKDVSRRQTGKEGQNYERQADEGKRGTEVE